MKIIAILGVSFIALSAMPAPLQLVSQKDPSIAPSASGGGCSMMPVLGGNGRYVLFASSANNLAVTVSNTPFKKPGLTFDVFLRDRASSNTVLASINLAGTGGGDQDATPVCVSTNGQFVLFESAADNLVHSDTNAASDVFVRDVVNKTTILVSANTNGVCGNGASYCSTMTPDGRYVAFTSAATDLIAGDSNGIPDVFVRDLVSGTTRLASVGATATNAYFSLSDAPAITPDGRYVAFYSSATNLVPGQAFGGEIFQRDMVAGTTTWISTNAQMLFQSVTGSTNEVSCNLRMSDDGNYIAFEACTNASVLTSQRGIILRYNVAAGLTDLVHTNAYMPCGPAENVQNLDMTPDGRFIAFVANAADGNTNTAIYLWDAQTGTNILISANTNNALPSANFCDLPVVSSNGQYVAFFSSGTELATNVSGVGPFAYLRDVSAGTTTLINADTNAASAGDGSMLALELSADGQSVAFESSQPSLVASDDNRNFDVFVRNVASRTTALISARQSSLPSLTCVGSCMLSGQPVSQDGHYLAFTSDANNLAPGNPGTVGRNVYVCDLFAGTNQLVSVGTQGSVASGFSYEPVISGNGRYVAFTSTATNLIAADNNNFTDVFLRDLQTQTTTLVSVNQSGTGGGNGNSYAPLISSDGRFVLFYSGANNLNPSSSSSFNYYLRDRQRGTNFAITTSTTQALASMTPDGHFVANAVTSYINVWDSLQAKQIASKLISGVWGITISPDGNRIVYLTGATPTSVSAWDRASNQVYAISSGYLSSSAIVFSANSRFLTYNLSSSVSGATQVYIYDFQTQSNRLVSHLPNSATPATASSTVPDISADGRFVIYRSAATNLVASDTNGVPDVFLFDTASGTNTILTASINGTVSANNRSLLPFFSGDGHTVVFSSWANDLTAGDFNQFNDLYAFAFLYAAVTDANGTPTINWPASAGHAYSVQYKNALSDPVWHNLSGAVTIVGNRGYLTDPTPAAGQRYYRVSLAN